MGADWGGSALGFWAVPEHHIIRQGVSTMGKHLCSLASSATLSVLGDDRQELFLLKNFTEPEMLIRSLIFYRHEMLGVVKKDHLPLFSSVPRQACALLGSTFSGGSTEITVKQGLESKPN